VTAHVIYLVGGPPRAGKSSLAQRMLAADGIPWLPTDVIRTVVRRVAPDVDAADQDPVDAAALAEIMYPHIEQAAEVCAEEADQFLIEGFELAPSYPARLRTALGQTEIRACFLGHSSFSAADLAGYRGPKPQAESDFVIWRTARGCQLDPAPQRAATSAVRRLARAIRRRREGGLRGGDGRSSAPASWRVRPTATLRSVDQCRVSGRYAGIRIGRSASCQMSGVDAMVRCRPVSP
jgi:hypothetical protein